MKKVLTVMALSLGMSLASAQQALEVNYQTITTAEQRELMNLLKNEKGIKNVKEQQAAARKILVEEKVIGQEAWKNKLERNPLVKRQLAESRTRIYKEALVNHYLSQHPVNERDMQAAYNLMKSQYNPNEYKVRHILVKTEKEAKDLLYLIEAGEDMGKLAKKHSLDTPTAKNDGIIPFTNITKFTIPSFANTLRSLKKGQVAKQPLKSQHGYHLIKVEDSRAVPFPALKDIRAQVQNQAIQLKIQTYLNSLFSNAKISETAGEKRKPQTVLPSRK